MPSKFMRPGTTSVPPFSKDIPLSIIRTFETTGLVIKSLFLFTFLLIL